MTNIAWSTISHVTFFYPSTSVGGAQYLVIRLAERLAISGAKVFIIDYQDGFIWDKVKNVNGVQLLPFAQDKKIVLPDDTTLIIYPGYISKVPNYINLHTNAKLLVWAIQPYLLISLPKYKDVLKVFLPARVAKVRQLLNELNRKNAMLFMDEENYMVNKEYFDLNFAPKYLPIPTIIDRSNFVKVRRPYVNIAWLGRISTEKVESIRYLFRDIDKFNEINSLQVRFHIIGDGDALSTLKQYTRSNTNSIIYTGVLLGKELDSYLVNEIDCVFAMGTSALDMAAKKIPTILMDISSRGFDKLNYTYKYKWVYDVQGFTLGQDVSYYRSDNKLSLTEVIEQITNDDNGLIGQKCFEYVLRNHDIDVITKSLALSASKTSFYVKDLPEYDINYNILVRFLMHVFKRLTSK